MTIVKTTEAKFWNWFSERAGEYFSFENNQDKLFDDLQKQLRKVNKNLSFQFSPVLEDGTREFIITANGMKESFPAVIRLAEHAPRFEKWKIIAFRPRMAHVSEIQLEKIKLSVNDIFFQHAKDYGKTGLDLFIRNFQDIKEYKTAVMILLDMTLGEYDTEMKISFINMHPYNKKKPKGILPLHQLPGLVDEYYSVFNN